MIKPLLATNAADVNLLSYPMLASPKLDGIRCLIFGGRAVTRELKPIPNKHIQHRIGNSNLEGLDGELLVGDETAKKVFQNTSSGVMSREGVPEFKYRVFDSFLASGGYQHRLQTLEHYRDNPYIKIVEQTLVHNPKELMELENRYVEMGYEGLMLRSLEGRYKHGRSTLKEGILLKVKRFEDTEATILDFVEQQHNDNEATINALGHTERSSHKANMIGANTLGALVVRSDMFKETFQVGSGFTAAQRKEIWDNKELYRFQTIKFKFQRAGILDLPRFPIFLGFRKD